MKVALDIGHCSTGDQGAVSRDGLAEHPFWAQYTPAITKELQKMGHQVRVFRREDYSRSIKNECVAINAWGADVAVSLHLNSADSPTCKVAMRWCITTAAPKVLPWPRRLMRNLT